VDPLHFLEQIYNGERDATFESSLSISHFPDVYLLYKAVETISKNILNEMKTNFDEEKWKYMLEFDLVSFDYILFKD
jgi:hypothetical protein